MITKSVVGSIVSIMVGFAIGGCGNRESASLNSKFAVEFQVTNDDGEPLPGASIAIGKALSERTGSDGLLKVKINGVEGQSESVNTMCPEGFTGPDKPALLRLTRTRRVNVAGYQPMRVEAVCLRNARDIVVVVRAQGGAGLPLQVDGKPAGTTDTDGIAHVLVKADRSSSSLNVMLDTSARQDLRPKNPARAYELAGNDALLVFDQAFVSTPKPLVHGSGTKPRKHIPYRVD